MKYDDASWHYGGDYPQGISETNANTHIGMFLAWMLVNGFGGVLHVEELEQEFADLVERRNTPGRYLERCCDGKLTDEDFNVEGNDFAASYYVNQYIEDYVSVLAEDHDSQYFVEDSWDNFDRLAPVIAKRFEQWKASS